MRVAAEPVLSKARTELSVKPLMSIPARCNPRRSAVVSAEMAKISCSVSVIAMLVQLLVGQRDFGATFHPLPDLGLFVFRQRRAALARAVELVETFRGGIELPVGHLADLFGGEPH